MRLLREQGVMSVESKALDEAFADTDVTLRQRLASVEIEYTAEEVDCARLTFEDSDGRISKAIRTGNTTEEDVINYCFWEVKIGYYDRPIEEATTLIGIPQLENPNFPEEGSPEVIVKVLNASVLLQKNITLGGDPANYMSDTDTSPPLRTALSAIAKHYLLDPALDFGNLGMSDVIDGIDRAIGNQKEFEDLDIDTAKAPFEWSMYAFWNPFKSVWPRRLVSIWRENKTLENDYQYLLRISKAITNALNANNKSIPYAYQQYFNENMSGEIAKSDLKVIFGIFGKRLVFKFATELYAEIGASGIPVLDYRVGNNRLISFKPSVESNEDQGGFMAWIVNLFKKDDSTIVSLADPVNELDFDRRISVEDASINSYKVYKRLYLETFLNEAGNAITMMDALQRSFNTNIAGTAKTYGIPKLRAGQLICLCGLGYGGETEISAEKFQTFASYSRIYLISEATHKMDKEGLYTLTLKVKGCPIDGSDAQARNSLLMRLAEGIETGRFSEPTFLEKLGMG